MRLPRPTLAKLDALPDGDRRRLTAFEKLDIEFVQARGGPDVECVLANLLDSGDAGKRQEEAEVIGKIGIGASDSLAGIEVLGFQRHAVGRQDELDLVRHGLRARAQLGEGFADQVFQADRDMDIACLEYAALNVRLVKRRRSKSVDRRSFVTKGGKERERELGRVKRCRPQS